MIISPAPNANGQLRPNRSFDGTKVCRQIRQLYERGESAAARRLIIATADLGGLIRTPMPVIHTVAKVGDQMAFHYLARRGVPMSTVDHLGRTPGHIAARYGHLDILKSWRETGGDIFVADSSGQGLPAQSCQGHHRHILQWLLDAGLRADGFDPTTGGLLHVALEYQAPASMVRMICVAGAPVNLQDDVGNTALHLAVETGQAESALMLLEAGADPTIINVLGLAADVMPPMTEHTAGYRRAVALATRQRWSYQLMRARSAGRLVAIE